jgi:hypothetical protein
MKIRIRNLHTRAGRFGLDELVRRGRRFVGTFVAVAEVIACAQPEDGGRLRRLVDEIAAQAHPVLLLEELRELVGDLDAKQRRRRMVDRMGREQAARRKLIETWQDVLREDEDDPWNELVETRGLLGLDGQEAWA